MSRDLETQVRSALRGVLREMGLLAFPQPKQGPRVLFVVHGGSPRQEEAFTQIEALQQAAGKTSLYVVDADRLCVEAREVKEQTGTRCLLSNVPQDAVDRVLALNEWLVLPTLPLGQADRASRLGGTEPCLIMDALLSGKKVLAANDSFRRSGVVLQPGLEQRIQEVMTALKSYGVITVPLDQLAQRFKQETQKSPPPAQGKGRAGAENNPNRGPALKYVSARNVRDALDAGQKVIRLAADGTLGPLAKDLAREAGLKIEKEFE